MDDGGSDTVRTKLIEPTQASGKTDQTQVDIVVTPNATINKDKIEKNKSKMNRFIRNIKPIFSYFLSQLPGFMLIFYLCHLFFGGFIYIILSLLSIGVFFYNVQDSILYQPNVPPNSRNFVMTPDQFNLPYEDIFLTTPDGLSLHAYFIKQPKQLNAFTMLVLHGNAGNIGHRLYNCQFLYQQCHVNVMLVEYRGYGRSQGSPTEEGLKVDATTALNHILSRSDVNHSRILIFGRSLGGAVAIAACTRAQYSKSSKQLLGNFPAGLILENTFTGIKDMARDMFKLPLISYIPSLLVKNKFTSIDHMAQLHLPTLFISGLQDEIVPPHMMKSLYERSGSQQKRMYQVPNGSHNECWRLPGYYQNISHFIQEIEQTNNASDQAT